MREILIQITAPHFCAGIVMDAEDEICIDAAPILKYCVGKEKQWIKTYIKKKNWTAKKIK